MSQPIYKRILLKLSGEALQGDEGFGIDPSILDRMALEIKEFLMQIPMSRYLAALAIPVLVFLHYKSAVKFGVKFYRNKTFIALATLLIVPSSSFRDLKWQER